MIVRRCDECRNLTGILLDEFFELVGCVPIDIEVVCYIFFGYTRISEFLHPRRNAVIVTADEHDFLAVGVCTCNHDREVGCVAAVLCEERPVCHVDGVDHFFREVDEQFGSKRCAVAFFELFDCRGVDVGVVVAEEVGAVCAHIVDESVAVNIPEVCALRLGHKQRIRADGNHAAFGRSEVTVDTCGDDFERAFERFLALCYIVYFLGFVFQVHFCFLLNRDRC